MSDISAFLAACWDEIEATAKCALMWQQEGQAVFVAHYGAEWGAIEDYDPAYVLADIAAKRKILARCVRFMNEPDQYPNGLVSPRAVLARQMLMDFAEPFASKPGYDPAWAV